jgi:hypothetical protein
MSKQAQLAGTAPSEARIAGAKLNDVLLHTGAQIALDKLCAELRAAQKQHPAAVGLTLAIALVERDKSEATLKTTRVVLAAAAKAGLDFDGRVLTSGLEGDSLVVRVVDEVTS